MLLNGTKHIRLIVCRDDVFTVVMIDIIHSLEMFSGIVQAIVDGMERCFTLDGLRMVTRSSCNKLALSYPALFEDAHLPSARN